MDTPVDSPARDKILRCRLIDNGNNLAKGPEQIHAVFDGITAHGIQYDVELFPWVSSEPSVQIRFAIIEADSRALAFDHIQIFAPALLYNISGGSGYDFQGIDSDH